MEFKTHLFLTGKKQVGKTTLLNKLLAASDKKKAGFVTKRILHDDGFYYVHIMRPGEQPTPENQLFKCSMRNSGDSTALFENLGCAALEAEGELILMDELGPHEELAVNFQKKVLELLDGDIPVTGVIQEADSAFLDRLLHHPNVTVVTVTQENRDLLYDTLKNWNGW